MGKAMTTIRSSTHRARKDYICDGCLKPIKHGSEYVREVYRNGDFLISDSVHWHCKYAEALAEVEGWYNAFSGEKIRALSFSKKNKDKVAAADQNIFIAIWGSG